MCMNVCVAWMHGCMCACAYVSVPVWEDVCICVCMYVCAAYAHMCACVPVCVHHVHMHTCNMCMCEHTCTHVYGEHVWEQCMWEHASTHVHVCLCEHEYVCTCVDMCIHSCMCGHVCMHMHICGYVCPCMCACVWAHVFVCVWAHMCSCVCACTHKPSGALLAFLRPTWSRQWLPPDALSWEPLAPLGSISFFALGQQPYVLLPAALPWVPSAASPRFADAPTPPRGFLLTFVFSESAPSSCALDPTPRLCFSGTF